MPRGYGYPLLSRHPGSTATPIAPRQISALLSKPGVKIPRKAAASADVMNLAVRRGTRCAGTQAGSARCGDYPAAPRVAPRPEQPYIRKTANMWIFLTRRLRRWVLLAIALPAVRLLVHRLALAAEHRDQSTRTARTLHQVDSAVTAASRRSRRKVTRLRANTRVSRRQKSKTVVA